MSELNFRTVILDGANIIHDNLDNGDTTLEPKRLRSAIEHCEKKGWETVAVLKHGTYWYAKTHPDVLEEGDFEILKEMKDGGKFELISQKDEDIYWIDLALEKEGYIITHDTFKDKKGEKRERSLYPDRPWDEIDGRTLSYSFISGNFICPDLPKKPEFIPDNSVAKLHEEIGQLKIQLEEERAKNRALSAQLKASKSAKTDHDDEIVDVFERLLGEGEEILVSNLHVELARRICGHTGAQNNWPEGWANDVKEKLGFPRKKKFTSFIEDISQIVTNHTNHRIEFNSNRTRIKYAL